MTLKPVTLESLDRLTILVIGKPGVGKTSLLKTIDPDDRICLLSAEGGLLSVRDLLIEDLASGRVAAYEIGSIHDFQAALDMLKSPDWQVAVQWVFIDSLTEIADLCAQDWKRKYPDKSDSFNLWGGYSDQMERLIKGLRDLCPYHVVFTCLESVDVDDVKRRHIAPDLAGKKLKERVPSYFSEVFHFVMSCDAKGYITREIHTQPSPTSPGKDRSGKLDGIEPPDLGRIKAKILGA